MDYRQFTIGEKFPLPIKNHGEGGLFQVDANGIMFILQLKNTDLIAIEAFRTGKIELALCEAENILFLLYQIDGIFQGNWGDAPLALHLLPPALQPDLENIADTMHLYLIDGELSLLLAMRRVKLEQNFLQCLHQYLQKNMPDNQDALTFPKRLQAAWQKNSPAQLRRMSSAVQTVPFKIPPSAKIK